MRVGVIVPQGWQGEYAGWADGEAWRRTLEVVAEADRVGFDSAWAYDHFHTYPTARREPTFESFVTLAAVAAATSRIRLGHLVLCSGYRNPALAAKMIATLDVASGGRMVVGLGAGWFEEEWRAYGYGFPALKDRLAALADQAEIIRRMLDGPVASFDGAAHRVDDAYNLPVPAQDHVKLMVGGNGQAVTWRIAARLADELNLDGIGPDVVSEWRPIIAARCREVDRDPASLAVSVHPWAEDVEHIEGAARVTRLREYAAAGVSRVMWPTRRAVAEPTYLARLAEDADRAGCEMRP